MQFSIDQLRQNQQIPRILLILIGVCSVWVLASVAMRWSTPKPIQTVQTVVRIPSLPQIEMTHLYGKFVESIDSLPETQLQITLQGVIVLPDTPEKDAAIISSPSQPAKLYHIGDIIPGDAELKKVMINQVVISNQGELERLRLPIQTLVSTTNAFATDTQSAADSTVGDTGQ